MFTPRLRLISQGWTNGSARAALFTLEAESGNRRKLNRIQQALEVVIPPDQVAKIGFYVPEEFISKLYDWAADDPEGGAVERGKPRKQKIALDASQLSENERKQREKEMLEAIRKAMKR